MLRLVATRCPTIKESKCRQLKPMGGRCRGQAFETPSFPCSDYSFDQSVGPTIGGSPGCIDFDAEFGGSPGTLTMDLTANGVAGDVTVDAYYDGVLIAHLDGVGGGGTDSISFPYNPTGPTIVVVRLCFSGAAGLTGAVSITCAD